MKRNRPAFHIILKYALLQIPGQISFIFFVILLRQWLDIPGHFALGFIGLWIAKDIFLFPFLWRYYDPDQFPDWFAMIDLRGIAVSRLEPEGYVRVRGEMWRAKVSEPDRSIEEGKSVRVQAVEGLKLMVKPETEDDRR